MNTTQITSQLKPKALDKLVCTHTGAFALSKNFLGLDESGIVFEHKVRRHLLRIARNKKKCDFYRSTPGIGTKIVSLDLSQMVNDTSDDFQLIFRWSPKEVSAEIISAAGIKIEGKGEDSKKSLKVMNNKVYETGDSGVEVMGATAIAGSSILIEPRFSIRIV